MKKIVLVLLLLLVSNNLLAEDNLNWMFEDKSSNEVKQDTKITKANCIRPIQLEALNDNRDVHTINKMRERYSSCMTNFINKQVELYNISKNNNNRKSYMMSINKAKDELHTYLNKDIEENQQHQSTVKLGGLGYKRELEEEKKKVEKLN